ncbi:MAG: hypothetical protein QM757_16805 [Paludibaculum sp.]
MLETLDLKRKLDRAAYAKQLTRCQIQLRELGWQVYQQKRPVVLAFEGWDAAGKGGAIKRVTEKLDPRGYVVLSHQRAPGRRQDTPLPLPLLAAPAREGPDRHFRPLVVRPRPRRTGRGLLHRSRMETSL